MSAGQDNAPMLDVLIAGGGVAGAAAAIELAGAGRRVVLIERKTEAHDKVCGEFVSAEAIEDLRELKVDVAALGAVRIDTLRFMGRFARREMRLPFAAVSLTRRTLDEALLRRAAETDAQVVRGAAVESLRQVQGGWRVEVAEARRSYALEARQVVLATGKHDLRGLSRPAGTQNDLAAFKMYFRLKPAQAEALDHTIELVLFDGGYAGLQLVEDGTANLGWVLQKDRLRALGGRWETLLAHMLRSHPSLRARMEGAEPLLTRPLAVGSLPYGFVRREAIAEAVWAVGDQAAVIPSFTGDGISLALFSGRLAAQRLLAGESACEYQRCFYQQVHRQVKLATALSKALVAQPQCSLLEMAAWLWPGGVSAVARGTRLRKGDQMFTPREESCAA